jgi:serine/threonine-protein kinase
VKPEAPCSTLGRYRLLEPIGQGGMGSVVRVHDPELNRDLALKALREDHRGRVDLERRFLEEAQVAAQLQHPNIAPVHEVGRLPDGRPYFTMKLVQGRTLAELLAERPSPAHDLARFVAVFEQVCQAVAFAHSKRVIHRDLKPANVMVGRFGEVQVMDWGLAKVLTAPAAAQPDAASAVETLRSDDEEAASRAGTVLGTPAYMAPEQARGEVADVDERADVFGLGAILCEILTGQAPFASSVRGDARRLAQKGDLGGTFARLDRCGADAELVGLAKACLAPERAGRPREGGEATARLGAYLAGAADRLRRAELDRAAAQARAGEERKRRRLAYILASLVVLLMLASGGAAWLVQRQQVAAQARRVQAERAVQEKLEQGRGLLKRGWEANDPALLTEALALGDQAAEVARSETVGPGVHEQVAAFRAEAAERLERAQANLALLDAWRDIALPQETESYRDDGSGRMLALVQPAVDEQYGEALRRHWRLDVDRQAESAVLARFREEPEVVVQELTAGLDRWMAERRRQKRPEAEWRRLYRLADGLDPTERRRQVRALLAGETPPPRAEAVAGLLGAWPPWPALWELSRGGGWRGVQELRGQVDPATEPVLTVVLLAEGSEAVGDVAGAERLLRRAATARPAEVVLLDALAKLLERQKRLGEAIDCYKALRARRPQLGIALGRALGEVGRVEEAEDLWRALLRRQPKNPELHSFLGSALFQQRRFAEAASEYQEALRLKPDFLEARLLLGSALNSQKKTGEAVAVMREAVSLKPDSAEAHAGLASILFAQEKRGEAVAEFNAALRLDPDQYLAHIGLALALKAQNKLPEAVAEFHKALRLKPDLAEAHVHLGAALHAQNKVGEAEAEYRKALRLKPSLAVAHHNLGVALQAQRKSPEAIAEYKEALRLQPDLPEARVALGSLWVAQGKLSEAEAEFREALSLRRDYAEAHAGLGVALFAQKRSQEAMTEYKEALRLKSDLPEVHYGLGAALFAQNKPEEAVAEFQEALHLKPDYPEARMGLRTAQLVQGQLAAAQINQGFALRTQGKFTESLAAFRRCHELGAKTPGWPYPSAVWLRQAERLVELDEKLPALLKGEVRPRDAAEQLEFANVCLLKRWYTASARFSSDAFTAKPALADDLYSSCRYNAACAAVLASCGEGKDPPTDDEERVRLRKQGFDWLRADAAAQGKRLKSWWPGDPEAALLALTHWRRDPDLASVRDKDALEKLPEDERKQWQKLWADVEALLKGGEPPKKD